MAKKKSLFEFVDFENVNKEIEKNGKDILDAYDEYRKQNPYRPEDIIGDYEKLREQNPRPGVAQSNPTSQPQAFTKEDVDAQDSRTRLYQSLQEAYNRQKEQSDKNYDKAIAQTDQQMMNRGMGRSSYTGQILAQMRDQKVRASSDIDSAMIADYQNRVTQLEQQEREEEWRQTQFNYQKERDSVADEQWQKQFQAQQDQWKQQFDYNKKTADQQIAFNYIMNMLEKGDKPSDALLKQAGISRRDYEQMKKTAVVKSSGSKSPSGEWTKYNLTKQQWDALTEDQKNKLRNGVPDQSQQESDYERFLREMRAMMSKNSGTSKQRPTGNGIYGNVLIE